MNNMLIDMLPRKVELNGKMYDIRTNFRTSILFEQLMQDDNIDDFERGMKAIKLYFYKHIKEEDLEEAINKIYWFYSGGKDDLEESITKNTNSNNERLYDYNFDDEYIYAAFLDQYNIDLQNIKYLHWWKFKSMFKSLNENHKISEIMKYRGINLKDIKDEEEKKFYKKMKEVYKLPEDHKQLKEKKELSEIEKALMGDGILPKL